MTEYMKESQKHDCAVSVCVCAWVIMVHQGLLKLIKEMPKIGFINGPWTDILRIKHLSKSLVAAAGPKCVEE